MANSVDVIDGNRTKTTDYNNLRKDVLDTTTGHKHDGVNAVLEGYVDRGSVAAFDFLIGDLTADGAEHNLDLSAIVPAGARAVHLLIALVNNTAQEYIRIQELTGVNEKNKIHSSIIVANIPQWLEGFQALPSTRVLIFSASNGGTWSSLSIVVKGWIM